MASLENYEGLLEEAYNKDGGMADQAELALVKLFVKHQDHFVRQTISLMQKSEAASTRKKAAICLQKMLCSFDDQPIISEEHMKDPALAHVDETSLLEGVLAKLAHDFETKYKVQLFDIVQNEADLEVAKEVCRFIGKFAYSILQGDLGPTVTWEQLLPQVGKMLMSGTDKNMVCGFEISRHLLEAEDLVITYPKEIIGMYMAGLKSTSKTVQLSALSSFSEGGQMMLGRNIKSFKGMAAELVNVLESLLKDTPENNQKAISYFDKLVFSFPKLFEKMTEQISSCVSKFVMEAYNDKEDDAEIIPIKCSAISLLFDAIDGNRDFIEGKPEIIDQALQIFVAYGRKISKEPNSEWDSLPSKFSELEDEEEHPVVKHLIPVLEQLVHPEGCFQMSLDKLRKVVMILLNNKSDWKGIYVAIGIMSQLTLFIKNNQERIMVAKQLLEFAEFDNSRVKWIVADTFALFCEDFWKQIQDGSVSKKEGVEFAEETYKIVISVTEKFQKSQSSRLRAAAAIVLTDYILFIPRPLMLETYGSLFLESALNAIKTDHPYIKEKSMALIVSVSLVMKDDFAKHYTKVFQTVSEAVEKKEETTSDELKGRAIECISLCPQFIGKQESEQFKEMILKKMVELHNRIIEEKENMKTGIYVVSAWQRTIELFGQDVALFVLEKYWSSLKELLKDMFLLTETELKKHDCSHNGNELDACGAPAPGQDSNTCCTSTCKGSKRKTDTDPIEYAEESLNMIKTFIEESKEKFYPYVEDTFNLLFEVLQKLQNFDDATVRNLLNESFSAIFKLIKSSNNPNKESLLHEKVSIMIGKVTELIKKYNKESYPDLADDVILLLSQTLETAGPILNDEKVQNLCELSVKTWEQWTEAVQEAETDYENVCKEEGEESETVAAIEIELSDMYTLLITCTRFSGVLMKIYREKTLKLRDFLMNKIIPWGIKSRNEEKIRVSLFIYIDILEHLGLEHTPSDWWGYLSGLLLFLEHPNTKLRHAAAYGLGVLATKRGDRFEDSAEYYFGRLLLAFEKQKQITKAAQDSKPSEVEEEDEDEDILEELSTLDNITAAIGKFIEAKPSIASETSVNDWLKQLPLKEDHEESVHQGVILSNIVLKEEYKQIKEFLFGQNGANADSVKKVLETMIEDEAYAKNVDLLKEAQNKISQ